jgi:CRP-like cAMP-binding protein
MPFIKQGRQRLMIFDRMVVTANRPPPSVNRLLGSLPPEDYARIVPALELVPLTLKTIIHKPGEPIEHVYFPGGGFCSIVAVLEDGRMVEVATIGREGMVGVSALLDEGPVPCAAMVQAKTETCYRMTVADFRREADRRGAFFSVLARYSQAYVGFVMQSTACNAVHSVHQRLARWLLLASDRVGSLAFPLTQEFVAIMLGTARPTVTIVAGALQKAGLITYHRGQLTIVDRERLEAASCECYRTSTDLLNAVTNGEVTQCP